VVESRKILILKWKNLLVKVRRISNFGAEFWLPYTYCCERHRWLRHPRRDDSCELPSHDVCTQPKTSHCPYTWCCPTRLDPSLCRSSDSGTYRISYKYIRNRCEKDISWNFVSTVNMLPRNSALTFWVCDMSTLVKMQNRRRIFIRTFKKMWTRLRTLNCNTRSAKNLRQHFECDGMSLVLAF